MHFVLVCLPCFSVPTSVVILLCVFFGGENPCRKLLLPSFPQTNTLSPLNIYKNTQQIIVWGYKRGATDGAPLSLFSLAPSIFFLNPDLLKANLPFSIASRPLNSLPHAPPTLLVRGAPLNDRRHLALWT